MNNVTRDVISDLWPVYESGEASADTRALVEGFLARDPELAAQMKRIAEMRPLARADASVAPRPGGQVAALAATRGVIRQRSAFLASAILFTLWPLSFTWEGDRVTWAFLHTPVIAISMWLVAAGFWAAYVRQRRALRATEL